MRYQDDDRVCMLQEKEQPETFPHQRELNRQLQTDETASQDYRRINREPNGSSNQEHCDTYE